MRKSLLPEWWPDMARMKVYAVVQCYDCYGDHESVVQFNPKENP